MVQISNDSLSVEVSARGAEIRSIRTNDGAEWLWNGDPSFWTGRSPLLFPVIGRSPANSVEIGGTAYPMAAHGFARVSDFVEEALGSDWVRFGLGAADATRASFPFAFRLEVTCRLAGLRLSTTATVTNLDTAAMPFQFGFHPGFVWPLPRSAGQLHKVVLANGASPDLYRLDAQKLLLRQPSRSPFAAGELAPAPTMFDDDAMLFPAGAGNDVSFVAEGGAGLRMITENLPNFAIWQKPGAPFLCLEPWHGTAPFADAGNRLEDRNGGALLAPGESLEFRMDLAFTSAV